MTAEEVHRQLALIVGPEGVSDSTRELLLHASDALRPTRHFPGSDSLTPHPEWVVWPRTAAQVQELVLLAGRTRTPLVPYGGGSGLMGGALPSRGGIVVDMRRLNRVRTIDAEARTATAEAGVVLEDLNSALCPHGLVLGHDPWTVPVATVGGTISTNSLGYLGAQYGSMGQQVLGLEVVLPDGSLVTTRPVPKSSTGPSLHHLFIGTEGCFGLITAATLRLFPIPEKRLLYALQFSGFEEGFRAIQGMFAIGLTPALMELGEEYPTVLPRGWGRRPAAEGGELYLGFEGPSEVVDAQAKRALSICALHRGVEMPSEEALAFWEGRHAAAERFAANRETEGRAPYFQAQGEGPLVDYLHVALPASRVLGFRVQAMRVAYQNGVQVRECGLWNRPELFSMVLVDPTGQPGLLSRAVDRVLMLAQDVGGSMEYCHGVGLRLAHLMRREHGRGLDVLRRLKAAVDPQGIMNPGKLGL